MSDFLDRFKRARRLPWSKPPRDVGERARRRPSDPPVPPPDAESRDASISPDDVRSHGLRGGVSTFSHSVSGAETSISVTSPDGEGLWIVEGRVWRRPSSTVELTVALVMGDHVLAETRIPAGDVFRFEELLVDD